MHIVTPPAAPTYSRREISTTLSCNCLAQFITTPEFRCIGLSGTCRYEIVGALEVVGYRKDWKRRPLKEKAGPAEVNTEAKTSPW